MSMSINSMIKYSNWKCKMNVQALRRYRMKDAIVAKLPIKIIRMQSIVTFAHWHTVWSVDKKQGSIRNLKINHKGEMCAKFVILSFIFMRWWKKNRSRFIKQIRKYLGRRVLDLKSREVRKILKRIGKIRSNTKKCMRWIKKRLNTWLKKYWKKKSSKRSWNKKEIKKSSNK